MADLSQLESYYAGKVEPIYRAISGTTLHLAMVEREGESHAAGTARTKEFLAARLMVDPNDLLVDLASGYGDATKFLARRFRCRIVAVNLIHVQNIVALRELRKSVPDATPPVVEGDFARIPIIDNAARVVWCQEALLHATDRAAVIEECKRVLQPGGQFILTDILQTGAMEAEEQRLIYARVGVETLESFAGYERLLAQAGLDLVEQMDLSRHVGPFYADLATHLEQHRAKLVAAVGAEYVDYTVAAMRRWSRAGYEGKLGWGMFLASKN